ncbi:MAG: chemotaxis protein [Methylovirgula sp.]
MSRSMFVSALAALTLLSSTALTSAQPFGTEKGARAMIQRAITALKADQTTALAEFNDKNNEEFHYRDLYVFCMNMSDGKFTAEENPALLGTDSRMFKLNGDPFGRRVYDTIKSAPEGRIISVGYNAPRPGTTQPVPKVSFVVRIDGQGCGVGYYR